MTIRGASDVELLANRPSSAECAQLLAFGASTCLAMATQARDILNTIHLASRGMQLIPRDTSGANPTSSELLIEVMIAAVCAALVMLALFAFLDSATRFSASDGSSGGLIAAAVGMETLTPTAFPAAPSGASAVAATRQYGTKVSFTMNEAVIVRFTVVQRQLGRKARNGRCLKPTRANRRARRCTHLVTMPGSFTVAGKSGANSFRFTGRLAGRKLKRGNYQLVATPSAGGKTGRGASASFRIIK